MQHRHQGGSVEEQILVSNSVLKHGGFGGAAGWRLWLAGGRNIK